MRSVLALLPSRASGTRRRCGTHRHCFRFGRRGAPRPLSAGLRARCGSALESARASDFVPSGHLAGAETLALRAKDHPSSSSPPSHQSELAAARGHSRREPVGFGGRHGPQASGSATIEDRLTRDPRCENRRVCGGFLRSGRLDSNQRPSRPQRDALLVSGGSSCFSAFPCGFSCSELSRVSCRLEPRIEPWLEPDCAHRGRPPVRAIGPENVGSGWRPRSARLRHRRSRRFRPGRHR
jgi:hypothetical protein